MFDVHRVGRGNARRAVGTSATSSCGNTAKNLPWTCISAGSQTAHAMTRAAHAAATDAIKKLQEIAAKAHGGSPDAYKVADEQVSPDRAARMTFAQAAQKAIELGGKYDGHELPEDINNFTKTSAKNLVGQGLMGGRARTPIRATASRSPSSSASPKSKSTSKPAVVTGARLPGGRRRRHGAQPAQPEGSAASAARCSASATR